MVHQQSPAAHYQHKLPPSCDLQRFKYWRLQQIVQHAGSMRSMQTLVGWWTRLKFPHHKCRRQPNRLGGQAEAVCWRRLGALNYGRRRRRRQQHVLLRKGQAPHRHMLAVCWRSQLSRLTSKWNKQLRRSGQRHEQEAPLWKWSHHSAIRLLVWTGISRVNERLRELLCWKTKKRNLGCSS